MSMIYDHFDSQLCSQNLPWQDKEMGENYECPFSEHKKGNIWTTFWKNKVSTSISYQTLCSITSSRLCNRAVYSVREGGLSSVSTLALLFVWMCGKISSRAKSAAPKCSHKSRDGTFECVGLRFVAKSSWTLLTNSQPPRYYIVFVIFSRILFWRRKRIFVVAVSVVGGSLAAFFLSHCCSGDCR
jgi:hypothetical protein